MENLLKNSVFKGFSKDRFSENIKIVADRSNFFYLQEKGCMI